MLRSSGGPGGEEDGADSTGSGAAEDRDNLLGLQALQVSSSRFFFMAFLVHHVEDSIVDDTVLRKEVHSTYPLLFFHWYILCRVPLRGRTSSLYMFSWLRTSTIEWPDRTAQQRVATRLCLRLLKSKSYRFPQRQHYWLLWTNQNTYHFSLGYRGRLPCTLGESEEMLSNLESGMITFEMTVAPRSHGNRTYDPLSTRLRSWVPCCFYAPQALEFWKNRAPSPALPPTQVIGLLMAALQRNDDPAENDGLRTVSGVLEQVDGGRWRSGRPGFRKR